MSSQVKSLYRTTAVTTEVLVHAGRCLLHGIRPEVASTAGTITIRDAVAIGGSNVVRVCPIATLQAGINMDGALLANGLTVQLSNAADLTSLIWEAV